MFAGWGPDVLLAVALSMLAAVLLAHVAEDFNVDSWLALVTGRVVWQSGIPHHDTLTALTGGAVWTDQQWLAQLTDYAIYRLGGLGLLGLVNVVLLVGPVAAATVAARRFGAPFRSVLLLLPLCLATITPSREIRTQELAVPLFVAVCYLLAADGRRPSRRVYWCLPLLTLWANIHGSVTLGAALVALRAATIAWERRATLLHSATAWRRPLALGIGALLAPLITPYGTQIIGYYGSTLGNPALRQWVTEWQPVTAVPSTAAALLIVAAIGLWSFGRNPSATTTWEKLALVALAAGGVLAVRNALFFGLLAVMVVPVSLQLGAQAEAKAPATPGDAIAAAARRRGLINGLLALTAVVALALSAISALARPSSAIQFGAERQGILTAVEHATNADPSLRVLADARFDDWLLWGDPALDGRIATDVRYELLSAAQMTRLQSALLVLGANWKSGARGYRLLVLDRRYDQAAVTAFLAEPGRRVLYDAGGEIVILRSRSQAGRA